MSSGIDMVDLGKRITARFADGSVAFSGQMVSLCDVPSAGVDCGDGTPRHWRADMCEVDQSDGSCGASAGPVICPHGKVEVYCRECDLKARVALHDAVALAVMEERERCAKIAESVMSGDYAGKGDEQIDKNHTMSGIISAWIAGKIRSEYSESPLRLNCHNSPNASLSVFVDDPIVTVRKS